MLLSFFEEKQQQQHETYFQVFKLNSWWAAAIFVFYIKYVNLERVKYLIGMLLHSVVAVFTIC